MRRNASQPASQIVRVSVPLDRGAYAKLCGLAALRGVDRSAIAASILRAGLRNVIGVREVGEVPGHDESPTLPESRGQGL